MGTRIVLFTLFLSLIAGLLSLSGYKKVFNKDQPLTTAHLEKKFKEFEMAKAKANMPKEKKVEVTDSDVVVIDMNDPAIKNGHHVYTEKGQCLKCHGENGEGKVEEEAPVIAGQHDWYVIDQVTQMKAGIRVNEKMNPYLANIDEKDIKDVAKYIKLLRINK